MPSPGKIILLNGSSSSGKSTLALALQQRLQEPYQHIALDQFRDGLPERYRGLNAPPGTPGHEGLNVVPLDKDGERVTDIQFGIVGERMLAGMRRAIAVFAAAGNHVIVDDLILKTEYLQDYIDALHGLDTWFIGVHASIDTVIDREAARLGRFPGTAVSHFDTVHNHGARYDLEIDTTGTPASNCAQAVIERMATPPTAFIDFDSNA